MKFRRTLAVAKKEFIQIKRDWLSLFMAISVPIFLLVLFGQALKLDVEKVPLVVWDQSQTTDSRTFISKFTGSRYFSLRDTVRNYPDLIGAIDQNKAIGALVIPVGFTANSQKGKSAPVQMLVDGSDSNTATIALGYADSIVRSYSKSLLIKKIELDGHIPPASPVHMNSRVWFNPELESRNNIVPGLIAVIMMVISALLTSLTIAREWERGTMEQLISTPVKTSELMMGKFIPYFVIGLIDVVLIGAVGEFFFHVPFRGSVFLMMFMSVIFLIGSLFLGMFISTLTKSQLVASQMAMVSTFLPSFLLSGFMTTISNMPLAIQYITYFVPARYFVTLLKSIYLKGVGLNVLYEEACFLALFSLLMIVLTKKKFKKKWS